MSKPKYGYCRICGGRIDQGMKWTLTSMMFRIHANPNRCIQELRPGLVEAWLEANPLFRMED